MEPKRAGPVPLVVLYLGGEGFKYPFGDSVYYYPPLPPQKNETLTARFREGYIYLRNRGRKGGRNYILSRPYVISVSFLVGRAVVELLEVLRVTLLFVFQAL